MRRPRRSTVFRTALAAALAAITVPLIAHAASGETTATPLGLITKDVLVLDNALGVKRITDDTEITSATTKDDGELHLSNVWFGPPVGQHFANGATYDVAEVRTTSVGSIGNVCRTFENQIAGVKSGTLTVDSVEYNGDSVTSIAASWIVECASSNGSTSSQGFLRFASDGPHPLVTPAPIEMPEAGRSNPVEATVTLTNAGNAATGTLGAATVEPSVAGGQYYKIAADRCAGTSLAPNQSCSVDVIYERDTAGYAHARIAVAAPGYPGGKILAGVGGTAVAAPTYAPVAMSYPILNGQGIRWWVVSGASWFQVERRLSTESWQDVSGRISGKAQTWADHTLPAGSTAEYRVTAGNADGASPPSAIVTATRPSAAVDTGTVNALSVDADGAGRTLNQVVTTFDETWADSGHRTLRSGQVLSVTVPNLPGPGVYDVAPAMDRRVSIRQPDFECQFAGSLRVDQLAYTDDFQTIATLAATADGVCRTDEGDSPRVVLELRVNSAQPLVAVDFSPVDAGRVAVGQQSEQKMVTIRNTGTTQVELGRPSVVGTTSDDWTIQTNHCPATLAVGATCTVDIVARPSAAGSRSAQLEMTDTTIRGRHHAALTVTGVGTAGPPKNFKAIGTLTGVDLSWDLPADNGESEVTGYTVHRLIDGIETTFQADRAGNGTTSRWTDSNPPAGATYAVSARNQIGDGEPTAAQAPQRTSDVLAYSNGGVFQWALPDGTQPVPLGSGTPAQNVSQVAASNDGRYLAYGSDGALWTVRADSPTVSTPVRVASVGTVWDIAWSPDRSRLAYAEAENGQQFCVWVVALAGGNPVKIRCGVRQPSWLPDMQALVVADSGGGALQRIEAKANGAVLGIYAGTTGGTTPVVSPDGRWIAYVSMWPSRVDLIPLAAGVSRSVTLSHTPDRLSWSPGADRLLVWDHPDTHGTIAVAADGTLGTEDSLFSQWVGGIQAPVWQGLSIAIPPTAAVMGRTVSIPFDISALSPGTSTTCRLDAGTWAPCTTAYRATAVIGGAHTLIVKATEPSGRTVVSSRSFTVDAAGPVARMTGPAYQSSVAATVKVTVAATDANGVASYDVRYRRATSAGPYGAYVQPWTNTTATSMNLAVAAGYEYCVSVRAKDKLGNIGQWSSERCFSRPLDDRSLTLATTGWTRATGSTFYYGTTTQTTAYGKSLTKAVQGKRFFLVATRCPTCGSVAVYAGNRYLTTVNLAYPTTHRQVLLGLPVQSTLFSGTLKFTSASTGKLVQIDGLAVGRS